MSELLFHETVFGPVMSRRLGVSLGVNLLPVDYKYCTFNCIYCECGWTHEKPENAGKIPSHGEVLHLLEEKLIEMKKDEKVPDAITFAGNGEPTMHPDFDQIIDDTLKLRDRYFPQARLTVLSNASLLQRESVFQSLEKVDCNIQKLDAGSDETFMLINQPAGNLKLDDIVHNLKKFNGKLIIQSLFLRGSHNGKQIGNTSEEEIRKWIGLLKEIRPEYVMIYPIDRATPEQDLERIPFDELNGIARQVNEAGIRTKVFG